MTTTKTKVIQQNKQSQRAKQEARAAHIFMAPWFIGAICLTILPMLASLYFSFTDYRLLNDPHLVGLENYQRLATDPRLSQSLKVTFIYVLAGTPLSLIAALLLAIVLNRGIRGLSFYRSVYYLPSLFAGSVAIGVLWRQVFGQEGLINQVLDFFGIAGKSWVGSPDTALDTLILLHIWTFGSSMVIFLAGLRQIPAELYEASSLDGAGKWGQFWHVTIPMLSPIILFNLVLGIINSFQSFTQAFVVSGGTGGPTESTLVYALYLYQQAFGNKHDIGYASAMAWLLVLIVGVLTAINFWFSKRWVHYAD